jgi:hypothetical protein
LTLLRAYRPLPLARRYVFFAAISPALDPAKHPDRCRCESSGMNRTWTLLVSVVLGATAAVLGLLAWDLSYGIRGEVVAFAVCGALIGLVVWNITARRR